MTKWICASLFILGFFADASAQDGLSRLGEFKVNTTTAGDQSAPRTAMDSAGNFVVVWEGPDGSGNGIYAQRYNAACSPVGVEFRVNTDPAGEQKFPSIAMAPDGRFVIVWGNAGLGGPANGVYGRLYRADGSTEREFTASGSDSGELNYPSVAMDDDGRFVVVWTRGTGQNESVSAHQFSSLGTPVRGSFRAFPEITATHGAPSAVAANSSGDFVIAAPIDTPQGLAIYARVYALNGTAKTPSIRMTSVENGNDQSPSVALREDGSFVVAWQDATGKDGSGYGIFGRGCDAAGNPINANPYRVNSATGADQRWASVAVGAAGEFVVSYMSAGFDGNGEAVAIQRFDSNQAKVGQEFLVNSFTTGNQKPTYGNGATVIDPQGNILIVWRSEGQDGDSGGIYADKFYLPNQGPPLTEFRVNTTTAGDQALPAVACNQFGQTVVAWESPRNGGGSQVFFQRYSQLGRRIGPESPVTTVAVNNQRHPDIAVDDEGNFVIIWQGGAIDGTNYEIYGQQFLADGSRVGTVFLVNTTVADQQVIPTVAMEPASGRFVVAWTSNNLDGDSYGIYLQRFDKNGPVGVETRVNQLNTAGNQSVPTVGMNSSGSFVVAWQSVSATFGWDIFAACFDSNFQANGTDFRVNSDQTGNQTKPAVGMAEDGSFVVAWQSELGGLELAEIQAKRFTGPNTPSPGGIISVNTTTSGNQAGPFLMMQRSGKWSIVWESENQDQLGGKGIFLRHFSANDAPLSPEIPVNFITEGDQSFLVPGFFGGHKLAFDLFGNYFAVWQSQNQDGSGYGVYATKVIVSSPTLGATSPSTNLGTGGGVRITFANGVAGEWRLVGEARWRAGGETASGLAAGNYLVEFRPVNGVAPAAQEVAVVAGQTTIPAAVSYPPSSGASALRGSVSVTIKPDLVAQFATEVYRGQWRPVGFTKWFNSGDTVSGLPAGAALIEFKDLGTLTNHNYATPAKFAANVVANQTTRLTTLYTARATISEQQMPILRTLAETNAANNPLQFVGQIVSDSGTGSGTAVAQRVVLTAAHVLFDDATLTYATGVRWLHQRVAGDFEPVPNVPRGFYLAQGYASGRTDELTRSSPVAPGTETPASQQRDFATMFFPPGSSPTGAARNGASGYLKSDATFNWLTTVGSKTLIGYPTEEATAGALAISESNFGKPFSTPERDFAFAAVPDTTRVFASSTIAGVGGMSGGPLCAAFFDGRFYPAGIYLGGTGRAVVRAIDDEVIALIGQAADSAKDDNNNNNGGATLTNSALSAGEPPGSVKVTFEFPPLTDTTKRGLARWFVDGEATVRTSGTSKSGLSPGRHTLTFSKVKGLKSPATMSVLISSGKDTEVLAKYTEIKKPAFLFGEISPAAVGLPFAFELAVDGSPTAVLLNGTAITTQPRTLGNTGVSVVKEGTRFFLRGTPAVGGIGTLAVALDATNEGGTTSRTFELAISNPVDIQLTLDDPTLGSVAISPPMYDGADASKRISFITGIASSSIKAVPGQQYVLTAKPARGGFFGGWSRLQTSSNTRLAFTATNSGSLHAAFVLNPFIVQGNTPGLAGRYSALIRGDTFRADTSGSVDLTASSAGSFSGNLSFAGKKYSIKGTLNGSGEGSVTIARGKGIPTLTFVPRLLLNSTKTHPLLRATLTVAGSESLPPIEGLRQGYSKSAHAPMQGAWTITLPASAGASLPKGHGYGALKVDPSGNVRSNLILGDGTKVGTSGFFALDPGDAQTAPTARWRYYAAPYAKGTGAFIGELVIANSGNANTATGTFDWRKFDAVAPTTFADGLPTQTSAIASEWLPDQIPALGLSNWDLVLGADTFKATLDTNNRFLPIQNVTLSLNAKTGIVTGKFVPSGASKAVVFGSALLQQQKLGRGLYLLPTGTVEVTLSEP